MKTIFETCEPRPEVLAGDLREEMFAAQLRAVIDGTADAAYSDPAKFFENTYPTEGLKLLLDEALGRLSGVRPAGNAIIRLETAFGGGKTHNLIALYHAARGYVPDAKFVHPSMIPPPGTVKVAGVVGWELQPRDGIRHGDITTYTLWGELAYELGGPDGYALVAASDRDRSATGVSFLGTLIGDQPALIMLDEIARHLRAAKAVPTATGKSDLAEQTVAFLNSLLEFAASKERVVVVLTLADPSDAFGKETEEMLQALSEAKRLSARQERVITPTAEPEIAAIVNHRLFKSIRRDLAQETVEAHMDYYRRALERGAELPQRATRSEYANEMRGDYPFHPELLITLNRKTSTIPNFQKTRGALRLLAMVVRRLWQEMPPNTYLIHPFHLDLGVEEIANDLTSRLERPAFKQVIEADIVSPSAGSHSHAQVIDAAWIQAGKPPYARRAAITIFLHSLIQGAPTGVDPGDLTLAVLVPEDDPAMVKKATESLVEQCWFLDWDGRRYRFKTEPSLNKIIADEMAMVGVTKAKRELERRIRTVWKAGHLQPVFFPSEPGDVDDDADKPKLVIMHYDAARASMADAAPPDIVQRLFNRAGSLEGYRTYKNNLVFLVADADQVDNMVEVARRYLAIGRIIGDTGRLQEFHQEQRDRLKKMAEAAELDVRVAITKAYRHLYYPSADAPQSHSNLAREILPPQDQGEVNQDQTNVVLRVLKQLQKVLTAEDPPLAAAFVKAKAWDAGQSAMSTEDLRRAFARRMALRMLLDLNQLKKTIRDGISNGHWVYYDADEGIGYDRESPQPAIGISEDTFLYLPAEAERLGIKIKGREAPPPERVQTCPVCGRPVAECVCGEPGGPAPAARLHAQGSPAQAFQHLLDQCGDQKVSRLRRLSLRLSGEGRIGAAEVRALGLAIPQFGKGQYRIEQRFVAEFGADESLDADFRGSWDRYRRLKQVTDDFAKEASKLTVDTVLHAEFSDGLEVPSEQFALIREVLSQLEVGRVFLDAEPMPEGESQ